MATDGEASALGIFAVPHELKLKQGVHVSWLLFCTDFNLVNAGDYSAALNNTKLVWYTGR